MARSSLIKAWSRAYRKNLAGAAKLMKASARAAAKTARKSAVKPATKPVVKPAASPATKLVAKPAVRLVARPGSQASSTVLARRPAAGKQHPAPGDWIAGVAVGTAGARRYRLYRPPGTVRGEQLPLLVMLHGCGQDAAGFALSTRMNRIAARERFLVLYPEQDRLHNMQGCWNWYDTRSGRAAGEADVIMKAIDQVSLLYAVDAQRVAIAGLSAGASMAALLVTRHPERFKAVVMHSGIAPGTANSTASALGAMQGRRKTAPLKVTPATMAANWPPLMVIHGSTDPVVAASNGRAAVQVWADAAGATAREPRVVQRGKRYPMTVTEFKRGTATVATLVRVNGLGHAWSGGLTSQACSDGSGPDASRMVWGFASRQFIAKAGTARSVR
ncbi:MAG: PHB depolymerase family esterase [Bdellovibrionales bacterium]|nr:PHB depolymerase family esterase [Ramlibacter sp.]